MLRTSVPLPSVLVFAAALAALVGAWASLGRAQEGAPGGASPGHARMVATLAGGAVVEDLDGDGDPDLYVANLNGPNRLYRNDGGTRRSIHRWIGTGGSFGSDPLAEHLGLGGATEVATLEVHWPASGLTQTFRDVPANRAIRITEGEEDWETLEYEPVPFRRGGGGHSDEG